MNKLTRYALLMVITSLAAVQPVRADDGGWGAFLDWINRLSGPRMVGPALSGWIGLGERFAVRGSVAARWSSTTDDAVIPSGNRINMISLQPTLEYRITDWAGLGGGLALHRFGGDVDGFWHSSFPLYGYVRGPMGRRLQGVLSVGTQIFPEFGTTDFAPLTVDVSRDGAEAAFWVSIGAEYVWPEG